MNRQNVKVYGLHDKTLLDRQLEQYRRENRIDFGTVVETIFIGAITIFWGIAAIVAIVGVNLFRICQIKGVWDILRGR